MNFFKDKCAKIQEEFNRENEFIYNDFDQYRAKYFKEKKRLLLLYKHMQKQEETITQMRTFIKTNLEDIFFTVEKNDTEILE